MYNKPNDAVSDRRLAYEMIKPKGHGELVRD